MSFTSLSILYMNDTNEEQDVYVEDLSGDPQPVAPHSNKQLSIQLDEGKGVFVKTWGKTVLLSTYTLPRS